MCVTDGGDSADTSMNCSWTRVSELCTGTDQNWLKLILKSLFVLTHFHVYPVVENVATGGEGDTGKLDSPPPYSHLFP